MGERYRFGAVEIRPAERQLVVDGRPAAVGSRAFDVLIALVEHRDRVVAKNELLDLAWPGLVVEENNLQAQVSALRRLLGPQAIATIPGRGYRFTLAEGTPSRAVGQAPHLDEPAASRSPRPSLPKLPGVLLGRADELAALGRLLEQHRLVTVVGAAGIGKTCVALAAAEERLAKLRDGAFWIELPPIADGALVPAAMAQALQVQVSAGADIRVALMAALKNMEALLVVDNAEHVVDAVAELVDAILAQSSQVAVLVTSRSPLKLRSERVFRLAPLGIPEADATLEEARTFGAIALLEARAQAVDPRFALTAGNLTLAIDICRHLDGIALAIELAAARLPLLGMRGLAERIDERFRLLTAGSRLAPTRQQTLLAALDWSYGLLSPTEQKVFRRLGVIAAGFSLATATAVARDESTDEWAAIDALGALVDRSLVEVDGAAIPRYRILESARAYALLKLAEAGPEDAAAHHAHAKAMLALFEKAEPELWTRPEAEWLADYAVELDNVRAALDWSTRHDPALAIALLGEARSLFLLQGVDFELRMRCEAVEPGALPQVPPAAQALYWLARSESARFVQRELAATHALAAVAIFRELGDARGLYIALSNAALSPLPEMGRALVDEMKKLERPDWSPLVRIWGARAESYVVLCEGRFEELGATLERALELSRACQSHDLVIRSLANLADHALTRGDARKAAQLGRELLTQLSPRNSYHRLVVYGNLANALVQGGELEEAREIIARFQTQSRAAQWDALQVFAPVFPLLAALEGRVESAARLLGVAHRGNRSIAAPPEHNEARAYDLALARVDAKLAPAQRDRLMEEGAHLDEEAVCALTLERGAGPALSRVASRTRKAPDSSP